MVRVKDLSKTGLSPQVMYYCSILEVLPLWLRHCYINHQCEVIAKFVYKRRCKSNDIFFSKKATVALTFRVEHTHKTLQDIVTLNISVKFINFVPK